MKNFFNLFRKSDESDTIEPVQPRSISLHWIIQNRLAVGPIPTVETADSLKSAGIRSVLTLCGEEEGKLAPQVPTDFSWQRFLLPDSHYVERMTTEHLRTAVDLAHSLISTGAPLYVHCLAGMERSPTVCVGYLCLYEKMQVWEALNLVKSNNPRTNITSEQIQVLQSLL
jgi:atypical dual specificity phosphatase